MDKVDKMRMIEERQKKWSTQRNNEALEKSCKEDAPYRSAATGDVLESDNYLSRLTDKLSDRIREEITREFRKTSLLNSNENVARQAIEVKMEDFLRGELSGYVCKICYEVMRSPTRIPTLLFPCGHTFCKLCIDSCAGKKDSSLACPYCRTLVQSKATNQSLKDLVDQFLCQTEKLQTNSILDEEELDDVFPMRNGHKPSSIVSSTPGLSRTSKPSHYRARLKSCEMRIEILLNELRAAEGESRAASKRVASATSARVLLEKERDSVDERIAHLMEEKALVESHLADQQARLHEANTTLKSCSEKESILRDTIASINEEAEKLELLATDAS